MEEVDEVGIAVVVEAVLLDVRGTDDDAEVVVVFTVEASLVDVDVRGTSVNDEVLEEDVEVGDVKVAVVLIVEAMLLDVRDTFVDDEVSEEDEEDIEAAVVLIVEVVLLAVRGTFVDEEEDEEVVVVDIDSEFPEKKSCLCHRKITILKGCKKVTQSTKYEETSKRSSK